MRDAVGPRWLHGWALLTVLVTLPLLLLGAEVTTKQVGMVDPDWPTPPWHLWLISWREAGFGFLIEHGHRLAGYTVGTCAIVLVVGLWWCEPRRWLCWLGTAALLGIMVQGLLGGFRVLLNALLGNDLALIHGCFGQMVFALLVSVALCTSRRWADASTLRLPAEATASMRRWSLIVVSLLLVQLVLGAVLRHKGSTLGQRGHLLIAFAVVGSVVWLLREVWDSRAADRPLLGMGKLLGALVVLQLLLGVEAWLVKFSPVEVMTTQHWLLRRDLVRSAHVLVGSCILATAVVMALESHRRTVWATLAAPEPTGRLEGAA